MNRTLCWLCVVVATALGLFCLTQSRPAHAAAAVRVVTAPWAAPSQLADYQGPALLAAEPPPLPSTPPPPPLTEAERRTLAETVKSEPLAEPTWLRYVVSNEWRHDVVFPKVMGLGGAYVGVATDQNYTVAAAARSQLLFLFDYDAEIGRIHRIYHAFLMQAADPKAFRQLFEPQATAQAHKLIADHWGAAGPREVATLQKVYDRYRDRLRIYLRHVANIQVGERYPTWLGDPAAYAYLRALVQGGRVVTVQGDLHGTVALRSIAAACKALNVPLRIFYTSNAEGFFKYSQAFRDNLAAFPHDERSVMLRTYKHGLPSAAGDTWHYNLHQIDDFLERLALRDYGTIHRVMSDLRDSKVVLDPLGLSYMDSTVPRHGVTLAKLAAPAAEPVKRTYPPLRP